MALQLFKIATVTVGSAGASNIDFTSIPQGYTDLHIVLSSRGDSAVYNNILRFNNDSASNYKWRNLYGFNNSVYSDDDDAISPENTYIRFSYSNASSMTANSFASSQAYIPNYTGSSYKSASMDGAQESNASTGVGIALVVGLWNSTSAINRVTITPLTGNFVQYSTATLYGIL